MSSRRLSARDYKRPRRGGLGIDPARARPFGLGLALGLAVATIVFIADHRPRASAAEPLRPVPQHGAPDDLGFNHGTGAADENADPDARPAAGGADQAPGPVSASQAGGAGGHRAATSGREADGATHDAAGSAGSATVSRYDFYQMLPKFQVVVPGREHGSRPAPSAQVDRPGIYFLQVGSYRDAAVADRIRAQVARLGIDAAVQRIAVNNDVWHRVRIGPIRDLALLNHLRRQLQAGRLDSLVVRVED